MIHVFLEVSGVFPHIINESTLGKRILDVMERKPLNVFHVIGASIAYGANDASEADHMSDGIDHMPDRIDYMPNGIDDMLNRIEI
jgi:hypothetical protein